MGDCALLSDASLVVRDDLVRACGFDSRLDYLDCGAGITLYHRDKLTPRQLVERCGAVLSLLGTFDGFF